MPQMHFYVSKQEAEGLRQLAEAAGVSTSRYLADIVRRETRPTWPAGYFEEVVGGWQGQPLERAPQGAYDQRDAIK